MIHVFIVDDHKMVIEGLQLLLQNEKNITVVGTAMSGEEALEAIPKATVDVVLMDINMPGMNGIDTCKSLLKSLPDLKVIAISMHKESSLIKLMLSSGAKGYVLKNAGQDEVINAITTVYEGKSYLDQDVNEIVLNSVMNQSEKKSANPFPSLSRREKDVLNCILDELTTHEIADKLHISFGTVETHRRNMLIKTGARNTAGLVRIALEYELHTQ
ncbi:MAG: response regulator transcription factor [Bacteroidota bacterium]